MIARHATAIPCALIVPTLVDVTMQSPFSGKTWLRKARQRLPNERQANRVGELYGNMSAKQPCTVVPQPNLTTRHTTIQVCSLAKRRGNFDERQKYSYATTDTATPAWTAQARFG